MFRITLVLISLIFAMNTLSVLPAFSNTKPLIKGRVVREDASEGQAAPMEDAAPSDAVTIPERRPRRLKRANPDSESSGGGDSIVKIDDFVAQPQKAKRGPVESYSADMNPTGIFDLGADANSRELVLAWEKWHKQFSGTAYHRTCRRLTYHNNVTGSATCRITVMRDLNIDVEVTNVTGGPQIAQCYLDAVRSMIGNPGITFPNGSSRDQVTFEYTFLQSPFVRPGYDWKHNDYERVRE